jgi:hypothetical protein
MCLLYTFVINYYCFWLFASECHYFRYLCVFFASVKFLPTRCIATKKGYTYIYRHRLMGGIYEAGRSDELG